MVGVLPIRIEYSNVSSISHSSERKQFGFLSDEGPMLESLDHTTQVNSR